MTSRGDVNAALNRLVREGVLTGFRTNFDRVGSGEPLCVSASAPLISDPAEPAFDKAKIEGTRLLVLLALGDWKQSAVVTVEGSPDRRDPQPP